MAKKIHKLPKFPPGVASAFKQLCEYVDPAKIQDLRGALSLNYSEFKTAHQANPMLDIDGAKAVYETCNYLLDHYDEFEPKQQILIVGALRYCAVQEDLFDELTFVTGLYDDKKVLNYVLEEIGIKDRYLAY